MTYKTATLWFLLHNVVLSICFGVFRFCFSYCCRGDVILTTMRPVARQSTSARAHKLDKWIQITFDEREETCAADNSCSGRGVIFCILLGASAHFLLHSNTLFFHIHKVWCVFAFLFIVSVKNFAYFFFLFGWKQLL